MYRWQARGTGADPRGRYFRVPVWPRQYAGQVAGAGEVERARVRTIGLLEPPMPRGAGRRISAQQHRRRWIFERFERNQQRRDSGGVRTDFTPEGAHGALGGGEVARLAQPVAEREQRL